MRRVLGIALCGAALALSATGSAQESEENKAEARRLYNEAREAMSDERYREAALAFEGASRLRPHAVALYTAAQAWELASEPERAADAYSLALATPRLNEKQAARARKRLEELEAKLGTFSVMGDDETRVQLDDHAEATVPARLHATAGSHTLMIVRADGSVERRKLEIEKSEVVEVDAEDREAAGDATDEAPKAKPKRVATQSEPKLKPVAPEKASTGPDPLWRTVGFVGTGAGVAALIGGAFLGLSANSAEDAYNAGPTQESFDHAGGLQTKTNVMLITGGLLTAAGVGLIVWQMGADDPSADQARRRSNKTALSLRLGGGSVWAEGRF